MNVSNSFSLFHFVINQVEKNYTFPFQTSLLLVLLFIISPVTTANFPILPFFSFQHYYYFSFALFNLYFFFEKQKKNFK